MHVIIYTVKVCIQLSFEHELDFSLTTKPQVDYQLFFIQSEKGTNRQFLLFQSSVGFRTLYFR